MGHVELSGDKNTFKFSPQEFRPNGEITSIEDEIDPAAGASVFELRLRLSSCGGRDCGPA